MRDAYDLIVYGNGLSALAAALSSAEAGHSVALAEGLGVHLDLMARVAPSALWPRWTTSHELVWEWRNRFARDADLLLSLPLERFEDLFVDDRVVLRSMLGETTTKHLILALDGELDLSALRFTELFGRGVSMCAWSDAPFFAHQPVVVAGNGDLALHQAVIAAEHASHVTLLTSRPVTPPEWLGRLVSQTPNIEWRWPARVVAVHEDSAGVLARIDFTLDGVTSTVDARGLFLADDPIVTPELQTLVTRLAGPNVTFAGALNGIPWSHQTALVEDGIRAARTAAGQLAGQVASSR